MKLLKYIAILAILAVCGFFGALLCLLHTPIVDLTKLEQYDAGKPTIILDSDGNEWAKFQLDRRDPIPLTSIPEHVINAFLAAEDHLFFSHSGISYRGIVRSLLVNMIKGRKVQGASTITQQLVRLMYLETNKTFSRKIKEQVVALAVEKQFAKDHILEAYLNHLYFGCGIYGVEAASQRFWSKATKDLTIDEAATLAAIIPSPNRYCPLINPERAKNRRDYIIKKMVRHQFITESECAQALERPLVVNALESGCTGPHARETIRIFLENLIGKKELYTGGFVVQTTINSFIQKTANELFKKHMDKMRAKLPADTDGALLTINVETGAIEAMVGGYDFNTSQFNRALSATRQVGSAFKPVIFAAAIDHGIELDEIDVDEPITLADNATTWTPRNFNRKFDGPMTLAHALSVSKNTIAVKTLLRTGIQNVIDYTRKFHLNQHLDPYPSLALGCIDTTVPEVAALFNVFAHNGIYNEPYYIEWVKDRWGKKIYKHKPVETKAISSRTSSKIAQALTIGLDRFKRKRPAFADLAAFGKSGTTNQSRTCWYAGATPDHTTVIYVGRDNNLPLGDNVFPSMTALPLWLEFNKKIGSTKKQFAFDPQLIPVTINPINGKKLGWFNSSDDPITILVDKNSTLA